MGPRKRRRKARPLSPHPVDFDNTDVAPPFDVEHFERRRFKRAIVAAPISIRLISDTGRELCRGRATLQDLSLDGAFLAGIVIEYAPEDVEPAQLRQYQNISFTIMDGPFKGAEANARPVRADVLDGGVGVRLDAGFSFTV